MDDILLCAVSGEQFPAEGKCLGISDGAADVAYKALCPYCRVWSSCFFRDSLKIVYLISCTECSYVKRRIEEAK